MSLNWFAPVAITLFGLVFGSFANVVIYRFPRGESLSYPGSHCPVCGAAIAWYDNVPVLSWIALRGKCRGCSERISPRYPLVEAASGGLWLLGWQLFGLSWRTPFAIAFFYFLLILSAIDLDTQRLPNVLVGILGVAGIAGVAASHIVATRAVPLLGGGNAAFFATVGVLLSAGIAGLIALLYAAVRKREGFGMGDVKLLAVMGLFLGPYGVLALFVASVLGAIVGVWEARRSNEGLASKIPFGPFLSLGAVIVTVAGPSMWAWYWGLIR